MTARYTVIQLDKVTGQHPEHEERLHTQEQIAGIAEFWRAWVYDNEHEKAVDQRIDIITSRDPLNGDWIGIANGGDYEWAEESFFSGIASAVETYLNNYETWEQHR